MRDNLATILEGSIVGLEPLEGRHEEGLFEAARDPRVWRWLPHDASRSRTTFQGWFEQALAASEEGKQAAFATVDARSGEPIGSTCYLALRPEHRGLEIGWTWLAPSAWGTGANVEAKLLMLGHAFERLGCMRVEFRADARNERSRAAPGAFRGRLAQAHARARGEIWDSAYYSVVYDEWPGVEANLRRRLDARAANGRRHSGGER